MEHVKTLRGRITDFEFHPEVYVYPTPRMYGLLKAFALDDVDFTSDINVYVHVPFCKQVCSFCGYLKTADSEGLRQQYVDALAKEIAMNAQILNDRTVKTLHFGGGTPSLLTPAELEKIINALVQANPNLFETAEEVSIEATPESVECDRFSDFRNLGINRVSLGVQSFNDSEIALSKRRNISDVSLQAIETLRAIGISNVVIDLMIGIEGQTVPSFEQSVSNALELMPETVELYALGVMPHTVLGKRNSSKLMSNREVYECYDVGRSLFLDAGYMQDCHNRYAIPNKGGFLQEDYTFQGMSLVGFGAGARTYAANVHYRNCYNPLAARRAIFEYIQKINDGECAVESGIFLDHDEKMRQYIIGNIESLDKSEFSDRFCVRFEEKFRQLYAELLELGLAEEEGNILHLTRDGLNFRDLIAKQFFSDRARTAEDAYR